MDRNSWWKGNVPAVLLIVVLLAAAAARSPSRDSATAARVQSLGTGLIQDSIKVLQLRRLPNFGSYEAKADTAGMCDVIMRYWHSVEQDLEHGPIQLFAPRDTADPQKWGGLYKASAHFLKNHCSQYARKLSWNDERFQAYLQARRIAFVIGE